MSVMSETNEVKSKSFEKIFVKVGFAGEEKTVFFMGRKIANAWNKTTNGPNNSRWHEWTLYQVEGGFRVLDEYSTLWQGETDHTKLSEILLPAEVAEKYPRIANHAVDEGIFSEQEIASPASEGLEDGSREEEE